MSVLLLLSARVVGAVRPVFGSPLGEHLVAPELARVGGACGYGAAPRFGSGMADPAAPRLGTSPARLAGGAFGGRR